MVVSVFNWLSSKEVSLQINWVHLIDAPHTRKSLVKGERFIRYVWRAETWWPWACQFSSKVLHQHTNQGQLSFHEHPAKKWLEHQQTSEMIRDLKTIQNSLHLLLKLFVEIKVVCNSRIAHVRDWERDLRSLRFLEQTVWVLLHWQASLLGLLAKIKV